MPTKPKPYYQLTVAEILKKLETSLQGLTEEEAKKRFKYYGPNKLKETRQTSFIFILLNQFKNSLIILLLIAFIITVLLREPDSLIIGAAVLINIVFGFIQEYKAEKAFENLKKAVFFEVKVIRGGKKLVLDSEEIVPGDIIILEVGDRVPADARFLHCLPRDQNFTIDESVLTGESMPVGKKGKVIKEEKILAERSNMIYAGTAVLEGYGEAVVCGTGMNTEIGKIAMSMQEIERGESPLQKRISGLSKSLSSLIVIIAVIILITGLWTGKEWKEISLTAIAVAVAALPEGLAVAVTVILAVGMQRILREKALVRKLTAAETLGSTTVICTDKTGTVTKGEMMLEKIVTFSCHHHIKDTLEKKSRDLIKALEIAALCNNVYAAGEAIKGSPTEKALYLAAEQAGIDIAGLQKEYPKIGELSFDSAKKFMGTLHPGVIFVKGAPEKILPSVGLAYCEGQIVPIKDDERKYLERQIEDLTKEGFRVLAGAFKESRELVFVAFYCLRDPVRLDVRETLDLTKQAGIKTIMITGDHQLTAEAVGREIGLIQQNKEIIEGSDLEKMSDVELRNKLKEIKIVARVSPQDKVRLVRILKEQGEIVAMTGDGVNDAPALINSDIGIALGSGTDVAKGAADIILLDDDFSVIVKAVEEGRVIFENIRRVVLYLLSDAFTEILVILASLVLKLPLPLTAAQILWVNMVEDGLPAFALAMEPKEKKVMDDPPRQPKESIINPSMKWLIGLISGLNGLMVFGVFLYFYHLSDLTRARTMGFAALAVTTLVSVFSIRSLKSSLFQQNFFSNHWLVLSVIIGFFLQIFAMYFPPLVRYLHLAYLGLSDWLIVLGEAVVLMMIIEVMKSISSRLNK